MEQEGGKYKRDEMIQVLVNKRLKNNLSVNTMVQFIRDTYGYKQSYAYELVQEARVKIAEIYAKWNEKTLEQAIGDLEEQKESARKSGDRKLVLEITKEINKITNLYTERIEHTVNVFKAKIPGIDGDSTV